MNKSTKKRQTKVNLSPSPSPPGATVNRSSTAQSATTTASYASDGSTAKNQRRTTSALSSSSSTSYKTKISSSASSVVASTSNRPSITTQKRRPAKKHTANRASTSSETAVRAPPESPASDLSAVTTTTRNEDDQAETSPETPQSEFFHGHRREGGGNYGFSSSYKTSLSPHSDKPQQGKLIGRYRCLQVIGRGTYGVAMLVEDTKSDNKKFVMKQIPFVGTSKSDQEKSLQETALLASLDHPNIVKYHDSFIKMQKLYTVMQYCGGGDLKRRIDTMQEQGTYLSEEQILDWFAQIASALDFFHQKRVLHRDLKTQNIFLTSSHMIKIGDFGIAKVLEHTTDNAKTMTGTPYYMSPEVCENKPYSYAADMFASGCILYQLCTLRRPFDATNLLALVFQIVEKEPDPIPEFYSRELQELVQKLLSKNPNSRPSAAEVLEMPLIRNAREGLAKTGGTIGKKIIRIHNAKLSTAEGASSPQDSSSQTSARVKKKKAQPSVGTKRLQSGLRQAKAPSVSEKKPSNGAKQKSLVNAARFSKVNKHARSHGHSRHPSNFKLSNDRVTLSTAYKLGKEAEKNPYSIDDDQQSSSTDFMLAEAEDRIFNLGLDGGDEGNAPSGNDKPSRANGLEKTPADGPSEHDFSDDSYSDDFETFDSKDGEKIKGYSKRASSPKTSRASAPPPPLPSQGVKASPPTPLSERARRSSQEADKHRLMEMYREDLQKQRGKEGRLSVHAPRRYSNEPPAPPMFRTNLKEQVIHDAEQDCKTRLGQELYAEVYEFWKKTYMDGTIYHDPKSISKELERRYGDDFDMDALHDIEMLVRFELGETNCTEKLSPREP